MDLGFRGLGCRYLRYLTFHVPKYLYFLNQGRPYIGTLGPKYLLFGFMDPSETGVSVPLDL